MHTVYDVIEAFRVHNHLTIRKVGALAGMAPTTFESMMRRRPFAITIRRLEAIANVFEKHWYELLNIPHNEAAYMNCVGKISTHVRGKANVDNIGTKIYRFQEHNLVFEGEEHDLVHLAELLRNAEGTIGDLRYQIEREFNIDGINDDDEVII